MRIAKRCNYCGGFVVASDRYYSYNHNAKFSEPDVDLQIYHSRCKDPEMIYQGFDPATGEMLEPSIDQLELF